MPDTPDTLEAERRSGVKKKWAGGRPHRRLLALRHEVNRVTRSGYTIAAMPADGPKSAYELAMERLRQKDREAGVEERPLTEAQKAAIAEARQVYQARMAEREILHRDALHKAQTREEVEKLESELAIDRDRLASDRDRKITEIKQQSAT